MIDELRPRAMSNRYMCNTVLGVSCCTRTRIVPSYIFSTLSFFHPIIGLITAASLASPSFIQSPSSAKRRRFCWLISASPGSYTASMLTDVLELNRSRLRPSVYLWDGAYHVSVIPQRSRGPMSVRVRAPISPS